MNEKDKLLIDALKPDARQSVSELARKLKVSRTAVQQRLNRLEKTGVIAGYTLKLGDSYRENLIHAHINLTITPSAGKLVADALAKIPVIETLYSVSGKIDMIAIVTARNAGELDHYLDQISAIPGIQSTETAIVLTTRFSRS